MAEAKYSRIYLRIWGVFYEMKKQRVRGLTMFPEGGGGEKARA